MEQLYQLEHNIIDLLEIGSKAIGHTAILPSAEKFKAIQEEYEAKVFYFTLKRFWFIWNLERLNWKCRKHFEKIAIGVRAKDFGIEEVGTSWRKNPSCNEENLTLEFFFAF